MKTNIAVKSLTSALTLASKGVSKRTTLPILANALIRHVGESLEIVTTDLNNTLRLTVPCSEFIPGEITVPVHRFAATVKLCHGSVELESNDKNQLAVRNGSQFSIDGLAAGEFPPLSAMNEPRKASVSIAHLRRALKLVSFAQSTDESRYILNGVLFQFSAEQLKLVATNGRCLALFTVPRADKNPDASFDLEYARMEVAEFAAKLETAEKEFPSKPKVVEATPEVIFARAKWNEAIARRDELENGRQFVVHSKTIALLQAALPKKADGEVLVEFTDIEVRFTFNSGEQTVQLRGKQIEGNYPHYRQVIPTECKSKARFVRSDLLAAITTAETFTTDKSRFIRLNFAGNELAITANSPEVGEVRTTADMSYDGGPFAIAFDPGYLTAAFGALDTPEIYGEFIDELSPGVFRTFDGDWQYIIMPARLS